METTGEPVIEAETPFGPIWLRGRLTGRPVMLSILGAFEGPNMMAKLPDLIPELDVLRAQLPGNHAPPLVAANLGVFIAAFDHAIATQLATVPTAVVGLSTGALVALGLNSPNIRRLVLVEPPLRTAQGEWLYRGFPRDDLTASIFGLGPDGFIPRDYMHLLDRLARPALVVVGDDPIQPRRPISRMPSLVDDESRERLRANPYVELHVAADAGHNVPHQAPYVLLDLLRRCRDDLIAEAAAD